MNAVCTLATIIGLTVLWFKIVRNRNQFDIIQITCAIVFSGSLIFIAKDFWYQPLNIYILLLAIGSAILGITRKHPVEFNPHIVLKSKKTYVSILIAILLFNPATLAVLFVGLGCGILAPGPNANTPVCQIAGLLFGLSSIYFPIITFILPIVVVFLLFKRKRQ